MTTMSPLVELLLGDAMASENAAVHQRFLEAGERLRVLAWACEHDLDHVEFCRKISRVAGKDFLDVLVASYADS